MNLCGRLPAGSLEKLLADYDLVVEWVADDEPIPGTYWGEPEAGLIGNRVLVRADTPVHSALHEASHSICMGASRRTALDTDAGGDDLEESAVCFLQILLAERLPDVGSRALMQDMDEWGYSFRLGSTAAWFEHDAQEARNWLERRGLLQFALFRSMKTGRERTETSGIEKEIFENRRK